MPMVSVVADVSVDAVAERSDPVDDTSSVVAGPSVLGGAAEGTGDAQASTTTISVESKPTRARDVRISVDTRGDGQEAWFESTSMF